jgi:stress-induced morphogen
MAAAEVKERIRSTLKTSFFGGADDYVSVSDGASEREVYVVVVSPAFDGKRPKEKHDFLWSVLTQKLSPEDWGRITLSVGRSPLELLEI